MPEDIDEVNTGGDTLVFADELRGTVFRLRESAVYKAEEVQGQLGQDVPRFGRWLPATTKDAGECWLVGLGELIDELQAIQDPTAGYYEVTRCEKSGPADQDPYEINVEAVSDADQTGIV